MTRRIFRSICTAAFGVFFVSAVLIMGVLYNYFSDVQRGQLRMQTELAARGVSNEGAAYFEGFEVQDYRITWIGTDGTVLYDSRSDSSVMENHLEREEMKQALSDGVGECSRYSSTLMERSFYCARRLPDQTVLRLSMSQHTLLTLTLGMLQPISIIFAVAAALSLVLAFRLSRDIVRPLNEFNLDEPFHYDGYDELAPLFKRLTAQKRQIRIQSDELHRKRSEFETITTGMAEGIVLLNERGVILSINPAAMRLFGADSTCVGKNLLSVNDSLRVRGLLQEAFEGRASETVLGLDRIRCQLDASPVFSEGMVSGIALLLLDVTEKEKSEQMRREFTANVSHELKTPLHTISGCAELLANGMVKQEDVADFSTRIYAEAGRMIRLVEDIIRLSHLDEGAEDMKREKTDLYALADEVLRSLSREPLNAGIEMTLEGESAFVFGVPQLLRSIIYNLCDNAVKYNRRGGFVGIRVVKEDGSAILSVTDTGIGIPREHQERIFERFYRVDKSHSKEIGGTGLGLSIVKHAARLHHAEIQLDSEPGAGTRIAVSFPEF